MNNNAFLYSTGTVLVAAVSALLISGWAQGTMAAQKTANIAPPAEITAAAANGLVRVVLDSPYGR